MVNIELMIAAAQEAPVLAAITWKRAQLKSSSFRFLPVKKERVERAIADDVEFLSASDTHSEGLTTKGAGLRSRAHPGPGLKPAASTRRVFLLIWQARQSPGSLSPAAGFEVRPKEPAGKIGRPTAVRTVFEGPGG
jgi:hypothetical protein